MAKYSNSYMESPDDDKTYSEELGEQEVVQEKAQSTEEESWKTRYGDLRRHTQQKDRETEEKLKDMQRQLDAATKQQLKFPKTESEIKEWSKKYPEVAAIVETIAAMKVQDGLSKGEELYGTDIRELREQLSRKDAETELRRRHPDFDDLKSDKAFHEWLQDQPMGIQDTIYRNSTDALSAARTIDFYKRETGEFEPAPKKKQSNRDAAGAVTTSGSKPSTEGKGKIKESDVLRMNNREFEKHEKDIQTAIAEGRFVYDISG